MALVSSALSLSDEVVLRLRRDGERGNFGPASAPSARACDRVRAGALASDFLRGNPPCTTRWPGGLDIAPCFGRRRQVV